MELPFVLVVPVEELAVLLLCLVLEGILPGIFRIGQRKWMYSCQWQ